MKKMAFWAVGSASAAIILIATAVASSDKSEAHLKQDITRHKAMAKAHGDMVICLESKKKYEVCLAELQAACKGLGIGKHCGMRHEH